MLNEWQDRALFAIGCSFWDEWQNAASIGYLSAVVIQLAKSALGLSTSQGTEMIINEAPVALLDQWRFLPGCFGVACFAGI
jgi:hypothetical protein